MARTFQIGETGIDAMMTQDGSILNTQSADGEISVIEGNTAMTVQNPDYQPEDVLQTNTPTNLPGIDI